MLLASSTLGGAVAGASAAPPASAGASERRAEACWRQRDRGFLETGRVDPSPARCAIEGWAAAAAAEPARLDLSFRRIEALWFMAHFASADRAETRALLDLAVETAESAVAEVALRAGGAALDPDGALEGLAAALAPIPEAGEAHFWAAVAWGAWGLERGTLASLGRGVATRLRRHAELAARLAPDFRDGGGLRLLGRLHATLPRVTGITGWVDRRRAVELLRAALQRSQSDPRNLLFLAEALLELEPESRTEALALLEEVAIRPPSPEARVEETEVLRAAKAVRERARGQGAK